jgi:FAD synthase
MKIEGARTKGSLLTSLLSFCFFNKKTEKISVQIFMHLVLQKQQKKEIIVLNNFLFCYFAKYI